MHRAELAASRPPPDNPDPSPRRLVGGPTLRTGPAAPTGSNGDRARRRRRDRCGPQRARRRERARRCRLGRPRRRGRRGTRRGGALGERRGPELRHRSVQRVLPDDRGVAGDAPPRPRGPRAALGARPDGAGQRARRRPRSGAVPRHANAPRQTWTRTTPATATGGSRWPASGTAPVPRCSAPSSIRSRRCGRPPVSSPRPAGRLWNLARMAVLPVRTYARRALRPGPSLRCCWPATRCTPTSRPSRHRARSSAGCSSGSPRASGSRSQPGGAGEITAALVRRLVGRRRRDPRRMRRHDGSTSAAAVPVGVHDRSRSPRGPPRRPRRVRRPGALRPARRRARSAQRSRRPDARVPSRPMVTVKVNYALDGPAPWSDERAVGAGTVHVADDVEELSRTAAQLRRGARPGAAVPADGSDDDRRPHALAGGNGVDVGLHPRPPGHHRGRRRHDRHERTAARRGSRAIRGAHGGPHRGPRTRVPRPGTGTSRAGSRRSRGTEPEPGRGRHQRRQCAAAPAVGVPSDPGTRTIRDARFPGCSWPRRPLTPEGRCTAPAGPNAARAASGARSGACGGATRGVRTGALVAPVAGWTLARRARTRPAE